MQATRTLNFSVDAKLLQELGERLVGRPYIALGELIKNSFDADARTVEIDFDGDSITVTDDGHGMNEATFVKRWMRIGTPAKALQRESPSFKRPLTGSKGVGRLSAQLLARKLELRSTGLKRPEFLEKGPRTLSPTIRADIDWPDALDTDDLTDVSVNFTVGNAGAPYANGSSHGTSIRLSGLIAKWGPEEFEALAREIWALQPPFDATPKVAHQFVVRLASSDPTVQNKFDAQMRALLKIANAVIKGKLLAPGKKGPPRAERFELVIPSRSVDEDGELVGTEATATDGRSRAADNEEAASDESADSEVSEVAPSREAYVSVSLVGYPRQDYVIEIPNCQIDKFDFEIRVFDLISRQPAGIKVEVAREYLSMFGGVHLYDNGFRLPYYGPDQDWLRLELDHARRISRSQLLPESLQVRNAMQDLPSNKRVFGAVNVSTSNETLAAATQGRDVHQALAIQITRDRLADNLALDQLSRAVRMSIDLYAVARAKSKVRRILERPRSVRRSVSKAVNDASAVVESLRNDLPVPAYQTLRDALDLVSEDVSTRETEARAYASLLGSLATAGMTSLAYEHEVSAQRGKVGDVASELSALASSTPGETGDRLNRLAETLDSWGKRSDRIRALFRPLLDEESRVAVGRYRAAEVIADVVQAIDVLARRTRIDATGVPSGLRLPAGTFSAWSAVLQNLLVNAFRATLESNPALVRIDGGATSEGGWIRVQDNGTGGVDLASSHRLFLPFERQSEVSERATALGLGGSGLGLTIVKMITDEMDCSIAFENPEAGWTTAVRIAWKAGH